MTKANSLRSALTLLLVLVLTPLGQASTPPTAEEVVRPNTGIEDWPAERWLSNPYRYADRQVTYDTASDWSSGTMEGLQLVGTGSLRLAPEGERYPRVGTWISPEIQTEFPFTEVLPSWNLHTPDRTGVSFFVRSKDAETGEWSPWLYLGQWGEREAALEIETEFEHGKVLVDYLVLDRPAVAYQLKARFESASLDPDATPTLRRFVTIYSGRVGQGVQPEQVQATTEPANGWARDLTVPFRAQGIEHASIRSRICSPTSTSMVMAYFGVDLPTVQNALAIYDPESRLFGNWHRAVAYASHHGLEGELVRVRDWNQVKRYIADGQPLICSIRFREGEFPSNVMKFTGGHLITIRGLTPEGDAIVNDSASKDQGYGVVYKADELARAWIGRGGVTYVIRRGDPDDHGM
ncbi:C39 family peptidase [Mucisphaera sp.]|uniref:C39 family peptidase n=1 Tax=Mucisphaera sp. TaxID=2913024 RepID=UPI003D11CC34